MDREIIDARVTLIESNRVTKFNSTRSAGNRIELRENESKLFVHMDNETGQRDRKLLSKCSRSWRNNTIN